ncbi:hypothetical protein SAMN05216312_101259 [Cohnella sp. OV330]|uniref:hypothetical protein n=1 Tax=Cohnella sp. OV330 TaxID=1855288 RepID=UPI0008F09F72|nr:hypothetical protein [Cohnella sp. OV330]SFA74708.1 hypothetical protein SAMN05216312_101259 [Cohnella sp. OV330]
MPYSTGTVTNTRDFGTASTNIVLNVRNLDIALPVSVIVKIFASVDSDNFYTAYVSSFDVPPNAYDVRTFFIAGNVAYEVQVDLFSNSTNALISVYGIDEFGNLVTDQRFAQNEMSFIPTLSPNP